VPCIFCGRDVKLTREHVFPQWLSEVFPDLGEADYLRRLVSFDDDRRDQWPGRPFDVVVKDVCADCNNGWMSTLEHQVQPILTPMLQDQPRTLTVLDQHLLSTWAMKTMLTMQGANIGGERVVALERYRWFCEHQTPLPGSHIWLCRYTDQTRWPLSVHQWGMTVREADGPAPQPGDSMNGFGVVFAIGPVAFWLFGYRLPGEPRTSAGSDDAHLLIWPALGPDVRWPPRVSLGREAELEELARRMPTGTTIHGMPQL
jgi:hypothetical protein